MKNNLTALEKLNIKVEKTKIKEEKLKNKIVIKEHKRIERETKIIKKISIQMVNKIFNMGVRNYIKYEKETIKSIKNLDKEIKKNQKIFNKIIKNKNINQIKINKQNNNIESIITKNINNNIDLVFINKNVEYEYIQIINNQIENIQIENKNVEYKKSKIINNDINNNNNIQQNFKLNKFKDYEFKKLNEAIEYRLNNKLNNHILLSKDIKENEAYKCFIVANNKNKLKYINDDNNSYELLIKYDDEENFKLYLDIDKDITKLNFDEENEEINYVKIFVKNGIINNKFNDVLIKFINKLLSYIKQNYGYEYSNEENQFYILKSQSKNKISYHIIFNYVIFKQINQMKYFMKEMVEYFKDEELIKYNFIDTIPYNSNQNLRLYNNTKKGKNNKLLFDETFIKILFENDYDNDSEIENKYDEQYNYIQSYKLNHKINTYIITNKKSNINIDLEENEKITITTKKTNDKKNDDSESSENKINEKKTNDNKSSFNIVISDDEINELKNVINKYNIVKNIIDKIKPLNKSNYLIWFFIIKSIKILSNNYDLFLEFNGVKYDINENKKIWDNVNINVSNTEFINCFYTLINHLYKFDVNYYNDLINSLNDETKLIIQYYNSFYNVKYAKQFYKIDNNLIDKKIELKKSDLTDNKYLNKDIIINAYNNNYNNIIIKSGLGTGKSVSVCNFLNYYLTNINKNASILIISPRISYSNSINETLEKNLNINFDIYNDKNVEIKNSNKLIMSIFSLSKIERNYDIIVLDEIESIINVFKNTSCHIDYLKNYDIFLNLINNSLVNLLLDGDINNTSLQLIKNVENKQSILYINNNNFKKREVNFYHNKKNFENEMDNDLKINKKIVIFNYSKNKIIKLKEYFNHLYPSKKIICHYSGSKDNNLLENKKNGKLTSINEIWNNCDILIYNSSITVGIDFNIEYFDKIYINYDKINIVRDVIQSINRIRNFKDNIINIYNSSYNNSLDKYNDNINIMDDNNIDKLINDIIKDDLFIKEYNEYIDNNNDYNNCLKTNRDINGIDYNIINKNVDFKNGENINNYLNMVDYFKSKYRNMDKTMKQLFNRSYEEKELNSSFSNSFFIYFFMKYGYNINIIREKIKCEKMENIDLQLYFKTQQLYLKFYCEIYEKNYEEERILFFDRENGEEYEKELIEKNSNVLYNIIIENQKNNCKNYKNNEDFEYIKKYIEFHRKFEFIDGLTYLTKIETFDYFISSYNQKYFRRYYEYYKDIQIYDKINNNLKKYNCIEIINQNEYKLNNIRKKILELLNIDKDNIYLKTTKKMNDFNLSLNYIKKNIKEIIEIPEYKKIYETNLKNKKNYEYNILKSILSYYNIDLSFEDKKNGYKLINPTILINNKNYLSYVRIHNNNKNNNVNFI